MNYQFSVVLLSDCTDEDIENLFTEIRKEHIEVPDYVFDH